MTSCRRWKRSSTSTYSKGDLKNKNGTDSQNQALVPPSGTALRKIRGVSSMDDDPVLFAHRFYAVDRSVIGCFVQSEHARYRFYPLRIRDYRSGRLPGVLRPGSRSPWEEAQDRDIEDGAGPTLPLMILVLRGRPVRRQTLLSHVDRASDGVVASANPALADSRGPTT